MTTAKDLINIFCIFALMDHLIQKRYPSENLQKIVDDDYYDVDTWVQAYHTVLAESNESGEVYDLVRAKNCLNMVIKSNYYHILYKYCR